MAAINGDETEEGSGGEGRDEIRFDAIGIGFVQSRRMKKRDERERGKRLELESRTQNLEK